MPRGRKGTSPRRYRRNHSPSSRFLGIRQALSDISNGGKITVSRKKLIQNDPIAVQVVGECAGSNRGETAAMPKSCKRKISNVAIVSEEDVTEVVAEDVTTTFGTKSTSRSSSTRKRNKIIELVAEKAIGSVSNDKMVEQLEKNVESNDNLTNNLEISSCDLKTEKHVVSQTNNALASTHTNSSDNCFTSYSTLDRKSDSDNNDITLTNNNAHQEVKVPVVKRSLALATKNSDPALCLNQIDRMYSLYYEQECMFSPGLMVQTDVNYKMRAILIDWLIEVHNKFKLHPPTLWLCVNIIDRYLEKEKITRSYLQLLGVTALLLASKYEEIYPPEVKECVFITDNAYTAKEVLDMELKILQVLNFDLCIPTGYHFFTRYLDCIKPSKSTRYLAQYYCERNLQEITSVEYKPHIFAAAAIYAALKQQTASIKKLAGASVWSPLLQEETGLIEADLKKCARAIIRCVSQSTLTASKRELVAAKKKFACDKYLNVSTLQLPNIS